MKIKTLVIYTFSFGNPDDVDVFTNQAHRLAKQGFKPLFPPSVFKDTVIQQWSKEDDSPCSEGMGEGTENNDGNKAYLELKASQVGAALKELTTNTSLSRFNSFFTC